MYIFNIQYIIKSIISKDNICLNQVQKHHIVHWYNYANIFILIFIFLNEFQNISQFKYLHCFLLLILIMYHNYFILDILFLNLNNIKALRLNSCRST